MVFETIIVSIIVILLFYFITSVIIREIGDLVMKIPESTFYKSSKVAGILSALVFLQFLIGDYWFLKEIILLLIIITLFVMTHFVYKLDWRESSIMALCCIAVYAVIILLIGAAFYFLQPTWG